MVRIFSISLFVLFLSVATMFFSSPVLAYTSGDWVTANSVNSGSSNWTSPNNMTTRDSVNASANGSTNASTQVGFPTVDIPTGSTITNVQFRYHGQGHYNGIVVRDVSYPSGTSTGAWSSTIAVNGTYADRIGSFSSSSISWFNSHITDIQEGNVGAWFETMSGNDTNWLVDDVSIAFLYSPPHFSLSLDSTSIATSEGKVMLSLSGHFASSSAGMACQVDVFSRCTRSGYAPINSDVPDAHILFNADDPRTTTTRSSAGYYYGSGFSVSSSVWSATNIEVPYHAGFSCDYPSSFNCTTQSCTTYSVAGVVHRTCQSPVIVDQGQGILAGSANYDPALVASPSATVGTSALKTPECVSTDFICTVVDGVKSFITGLFVPDFTLSGSVLADLNGQVSTKAPFAYVNAVLSMDTTDPSTSSAVPQLTIPVALSNTHGIPTSYTWTAPSYLSGILGTIKNVLRGFLWLGIIVYLFLLARRLTTK